jgi:beta-alanine degradation protein BauB
MKIMHRFLARRIVWRIIYRALLSLAVILSITLPIGFATAQLKTGSNSTGTTGQGTSNIPFQTLSFQPLASAEGPHRAIAFGNPQEGAHGFYLRLPVGFDSGLHYHTANYGAVVIQGRLYNNYEGQEKPVILTRGGFFATDGKVNHVTRCISDRDCIVYVQMDRAFDAIPVGQPPQTP